VRYVSIIWDADDDEGGNVRHIAEHGLTVEDVEYVIEHAASEERSRSSNRLCVFGYTLSGDHIVVVIDEMDEDTIYPMTAYEVPERG
jgi:uncharacterized DUF497 family protein